MEYDGKSADKSKSTEPDPGTGIDHALRAVWDASGRLLGSLACAAAFLILFAWLSEEVFEGDLQQFDLRIRTMVHGFSTPQLTKLMQALTFLGSIGFLAVLFAICIAVFLVAGWKHAAIWLAVAVGGSVVLDVSLKLAFHRARPVPFFGAVPFTYSYPSGHALSSLCFYGVLAGLCSARIQSRAARILIWIAGGVLIAGIGLSRIYLGVHYPTDVIAGYLAGAIWVGTLLVAVLRHARSNGRYESQVGFQN
jgi:membrane-associated phospholipid phosphatase